MDMSGYIIPEEKQKYFVVKVNIFFQNQFFILRHHFLCIASVSFAYLQQILLSLYVWCNGTFQLKILAV